MLTSCLSSKAPDGIASPEVGTASALVKLMSKEVASGRGIHPNIG